MQRLRTLVLNADYSPISVCNPVRGALLCVEKKAHQLEMSNIDVHAEKLSLQLPSVIVLANYRTISGKATRATPAINRQNVLCRDKYECQYCGQPAVTVDHVVPRAAGGPFTWHNLVASCEACNRMKGSLTLKQAGLKLRAQPRLPTRAESFSWRFIDNPRRTVLIPSWLQAWRKYI